MLHPSRKTIATCTRSALRPTRCRYGPAIGAGGTARKRSSSETSALCSWPPSQEDRRMLSLHLREARDPTRLRG
jgi:hypothetical protein